MSFLRNDEKLMKEVHLHWTFYLGSTITAGLGALVFLTGFISMFVNSSSNTPSFGVYLFWTLILCSPLAYKILFNMTKIYAVTDQRLYVEEGIIAKKKVDVPYNKINDIQMSQSIIQRIFGTGDIHVHTGNSKPTVIKHVNSPNEFKNEIFDVISTRNKVA